MKQMRSGTTRVSLRGWELVLAAVALTLLHAAGYAQARRYTNSMSDVTAAAMGAGIETTDFRDYSTTGYAVAGETITVPASADSDGKYRVMLQMQPRAGTLTVNHGGTSLGLVASTLAPSLNQVGVDWQKGVEVTILNGESAVVCDGDDHAKFVRVSRTSATALAGIKSIEIADRFANVVSCGEVTSAERTAGVVKYRLVVLRNENVGVGIPLKDVVIS